MKQKHEREPLKPKESLQKALAAFNMHCRRIRMLCIEEGDEHHLATSYNKQSRLTMLGIENNHAAIEGMPTLNDSDAKMITQSILAMRGVSQKKHKILHEQGDLKLQVRPMAYKGTAIAWMRRL